MDSLETELITLKVKMDHLRGDFNEHRKEDVNSFDIIEKKLELLMTARTKITTQVWMVGAFIVIILPIVIKWYLELG